MRKSNKQQQQQQNGGLLWTGGNILEKATVQKQQERKRQNNWAEKVVHDMVMIYLIKAGRKGNKESQIVILLPNAKMGKKNYKTMDSNLRRIFRKQQVASISGKGF